MALYAANNQDFGHFWGQSFCVFRPLVLSEKEHSWLALDEKLLLAKTMRLLGGSSHLVSGLLRGLQAIYKLD